MSAPTSILLPGLDGTATLFQPFVAAAPPGFRVRPLPLPNDRPRSYRDLSDWVLGQLPPEPVALIAESFSGPLALLIADQCPRVTAVVLCASFVEAPLPRLLARLPSFVWNRPPPGALVRFFLTGGDRVLAETVRSALAGVSGDVISQRIAAAASVNVTAELERFTRPLLFLRAERDRILPSRSSARARALKPSAHFADVQAPHLLLQTRPTAAWSHIRPFLENADLNARDTNA
jgi:pimeloyl-[acyl-carrier protein] methyl ester esterase